MENNIPSKGEIVWFSCCTNGTPIGNRKNIPEHMFLILTNSNYNKKSSHFCGVSITSRKEFKYQEFLSKYGIDIISEEINGHLNLEKESFILCDRPTRLSKKDLSKEQKHTGKIKDGLLCKTLSQVYFFLKRGKIIKK